MHTRQSAPEIHATTMFQAQEKMFQSHLGHGFHIGSQQLRHSQAGIGDRCVTILTNRQCHVTALKFTGRIGELMLISKVHPNTNEGTFRRNKHPGVMSS